VWIPVIEEAPVPYQALYRRFRPQRFSEVLGQEHVTRALRAAVRDGKVAHAYLFSGPRGTGKTSTARILAMALNCEHPEDGEPDGKCESCVAIRQGSSLDVQELDSATNRGIDEMRDLLSRVALGTPGRWKVYIVDEVHQMTSAASSALLKTLEEPPGHVIFVLATTDPLKVMETIRSRTQHFEFRLLGSDVLAAHLADVAKQASLDVPPEAIDVAVRRGHGSARDALSALDQVAAAGGAVDEVSAVVDIVDAILERDTGAVLVAVAEAAQAGIDPRRLGTELLEYLRNGFLATRAPALVMLSEAAAAEAEARARRLGPGALVRAMEVIGDALIDIREAADPRTTLEVALVKLSAPELDDSRAALLERIERLERAGSSGNVVPIAPGPVVIPSVTSIPPPPARSGPAGGPGSPKAALGAHRAGGPLARTAPESRPPAEPGRPEPPRASSAPLAPSGRPGPASGRPDPASSRDPASAIPDPASATDLVSVRPDPASVRPDPASATEPASERPDPASAPDPASGLPNPISGRPGPGTRPASAPLARRPAPATAPSSAAPSVDIPTREELTLAWGDKILPALRPAVKVYLASGRFLPPADGYAVFAVPDRGLLTRAETGLAEVEAALSAHFGRPIRVRLVLDDGTVAPAAVSTVIAGPAGGSEEAEDIDLSDLEDAPGDVLSPEQRLLEAFPGAEEVTYEQ
jgi:DNA polymerase III subunit gamma/tau